MLEYMIDTDICIYLMKTYPPELQERFEELTGRICVSSITYGELSFGAEKSARRAENMRALDQFTARLEILAFGAKAAAHFGELRADLSRRGQLAGSYDMLIGAHARSEGLTIVTNNVREFARMSGLRVENWVG